MFSQYSGHLSEEVVCQIFSQTLWSKAIITPFQTEWAFIVEAKNMPVESISEHLLTHSPLFMQPKDCSARLIRVGLVSERSLCSV